MLDLRSKPDQLTINNDNFIFLSYSCFSTGICIFRRKIELEKDSLNIIRIFGRTHCCSF